MTQLIDESTWLGLGIDTLERRLITTILILKNVFESKRTNNSNLANPISIEFNETSLNVQLKMSVNLAKATQQGGSINNAIYLLSNQNYIPDFEPLPPAATPIQFPDVPESVTNLEGYFVWLVGLLMKSNERNIPAREMEVEQWNNQTQSIERVPYLDANGNPIVLPATKEQIYPDIRASVAFFTSNPAALVASLSLPFDFPIFLSTGNLVLGTKSQIAEIFTT